MNPTKRKPVAFNAMSSRIDTKPTSSVPVLSKPNFRSTSSTSQKLTTNIVATPSSLSSNTIPTSDLLVDRYKPTTTEEMIGNRLALNQLEDWLTQWPNLGTTVMLSGDCGTGKCHRDDTKFLLFDGGIIEAKDIEFGTMLMGDHLTSQVVLNVWKGTEPLFTLHDINHAEIMTVTANHILVLTDKNQTTLFQMTVREYIDIFSRIEQPPDYYLYRPSFIPYRGNAYGLTAQIFHNRDTTFLVRLAYILGVMLISLLYQDDQYSFHYFGSSFNTLEDYICSLYCLSGASYSLLKYTVTGQQQQEKKYEEFIRLMMVDQVEVRVGFLYGMMEEMNRILTCYFVQEQCKTRAQQMKANTLIQSVLQITQHPNIVRLADSVGVYWYHGTFSHHQNVPFVTLQRVATLIPFGIKPNTSSSNNSFVGFRVAGQVSKRILLANFFVTHNSTAAHLVARKLNYEPQEINGSDFRTVTLLQEQLEKWIPVHSNYFMNIMKQQPTSTRRVLIIIEEFDGLDIRGGHMTRYISSVIKSLQHTPLILIGNEITPTKFKSILTPIKVHIKWYHATDKTFNQSLFQKCKAILADQGKQHLFSDRDLQTMVVSCRGDIRQCINHLHYWGTDPRPSCVADERHRSKSVGGRSPLPNNEKDNALASSTIFDNVQEIFANRFSFTTPKEGKRSSLDLYTQFKAASDFVQENYLATIHPQHCSNTIECMSTVADMISDEDALSLTYEDNTLEGLNPEVHPFNSVVSVVTTLQCFHRFKPLTRISIKHPRSWQTRLKSLDTAFRVIKIEKPEKHPQRDEEDDSEDEDQEQPVESTKRVRKQKSIFSASSSGSDNISIYDCICIQRQLHCSAMDPFEFYAYMYLFLHGDTNKDQLLDAFMSVAWNRNQVESFIKLLVELTSFSDTLKPTTNDEKTEAQTRELRNVYTLSLFNKLTCHYRPLLLTQKEKSN